MKNCQLQRILIITRDWKKPTGLNPGGLMIVMMITLMIKKLEYISDVFSRKSYVHLCRKKGRI